MIVFRYFQQKTPPFQAGSSNETWNGLLVRLPPIFIEAGNGGRFDFGRKNGIDLDRHRLAKPGFHVLPTLKNFLFRISALGEDGGDFDFDGLAKRHHGIPPGIGDIVVVHCGNKLTGAKAGVKGFLKLFSTPFSPAREDKSRTRIVQVEQIGFILVKRLEMVKKKKPVTMGDGPCK